MGASDDRWSPIAARNSGPDSCWPPTVKMIEMKLIDELPLRSPRLRAHLVLEG